MREAIIQIIAAAASAFGFALLFRVRRALIPPATLGGALCWAVYLLCCVHMEGIFYPTLIAAIVSTIYAEVMARILYAPAPIFFVPTIIALVPGSSLFYAMSAAVQGDIALARSHGWTLILYVLGLAAGASLVWALSDMIRRLLALRRSNTADL